MSTLLDRQVDGMILISQYADSPEVRALLVSLGYFPIFRGRKEMATLLREETARWSAIIKALGIQLD